MSIREWSKLQIDIFNEIKVMRDQPRASLVVVAGPGSGKTTTGIECLKLVHVHQRVAFVCFNKHTSEELKRRVPPNVEAMTVNSYGFRACREAFRGCKVDDSKTRYALRDVEADPDKRRRWDGAMKRLIGLKKATMLPAEEVSKLYDLDLPTEPGFMEAAALVWKKVSSQTAIIDFDDMWMLPVTKKLAIPTYDWVFIDEAQDLCATQIELLKRAAPRIVAIGDPKQSIYSFRGADPDAMDRLRVAIDAKVLPLNVCYRCPTSVIDAACKAFGCGAAPRCEGDCAHGPVMVAGEGAIEGVVDEVHINDLRAEAKPGSWVLCRTTAPLVKECLKFVVEGVKATVRGRDIGQQLLTLIEKVGGSEILDFTERLREWHEGEQARLERAGRDAQLQALDDRVESIHALAEGARTVSDIRVKIENVFKDEASPGVTFATAHRSKGLECDDVYILRPDLLPFPKAKSDWGKRQERNLKFVAYTRAMKRLRVVIGGADKKAGAK